MCEAATKVYKIINDTEDVGDLQAVRDAKERARGFFQQFIVKFTDNVASMFNLVITSKAKITSPSTPSFYLQLTVRLWGFLTTGRTSWR